VRKGANEVAKNLLWDLYPYKIQKIQESADNPLTWYSQIQPRVTAALPPTRRIILWMEMVENDGTA
jgi:hypothetical protein